MKGLAPLAFKTDKTDSLVLATLSQRDLVPAIWLPDPHVRESESSLAFAFTWLSTSRRSRTGSTRPDQLRPALPGHRPVRGRGRELLARLDVPEPWRSNVTASLALIDELEGQIDQVNRRLRDGHADHPYIPLLMSVPGIGWVLAFTIAAEIGEIERFSSPEKLTSYTGLCRA